MSRRGVIILAAAAGVAAAAAVWFTLEADFLVYPGWLAAQKADLILGPVLVGLYWLRMRPAARFGWLLVAFGFLCVGYIAQSASTPRLFGIGLIWESVIYIGTLVLILTFPTGRLDGLFAKLILVAGVANAALNVWLIVMLPQTGAGGAISACRELCPENGLAFAPNVGRALDLIKPFQVAVVAVAVATALLLVWRIATGTPPRRRALAIGTAVALFFLAMQIVYLSLSIFEADAPELLKVTQWSFTVARSLVWYGFLVALIAAQLFAGRALRRLVRRSLRRPSQDELEAMLREPLSDPTFQLRFWNPATEAWDNPVEAGDRRAVTVVERDGRPAVALVHDPQLNDDPELLQAAGAVAALAEENAELDASWRRAVDDLQQSRNRITRTLDDERRRMALNLHDGVQQRLGAIRLRLALSAELATDPDLQGQLEGIGGTVEDAMEEVREVAQGLYPHRLHERGLVSALEDALSPLQVEHNEIARHPGDEEVAVYYACLEAVQNARKHGGPSVTIAVSIHEHADELRFAVTDDGRGFDASEEHGGMGLQNLHDRIAAVGGHIAVTSAEGRGTTVAGTVPIRT